MPEQPQLSSSPTSIPSKQGSSGPPSALRQVQVHQADLVRLGDDVGRMGLVLVALGRPRADLLLRELARERAQLLLLVGEGERDAAGDTGLDCGHSDNSRESRLTSQSISVDGAPARRSSGVALRLDDVEVWRWHAASGTRKALLDGIGWEVRTGERWALLGPNGAGKTTLLTLAGAVEFPSRGTVEILGETMGRTDVARLRESIGFVDARLGARFAPLLTVARGDPHRRDRRRSGTSRSGSSALELDRADSLLGTFGLGAARRAAVRRLLAGRAQARADRAGARRRGRGCSSSTSRARASTSRAARRCSPRSTAWPRDEPELAVVVTTHHLEELPASTTHALLLRDGAGRRGGPGQRETLDRRAAERLLRAPAHGHAAPAGAGPRRRPDPDVLCFSI